MRRVGILSTLLKYVLSTLVKMQHQQWHFNPFSITKP